MLKEAIWYELWWLNLDIKKESALFHQIEIEVQKFLSSGFRPFVGTNNEIFAEQSGIDCLSFRWNPTE